MTQQRSKQACAKWQKLISEQEQSGQSVTTFCRERGLARSYFYYWKRKLREVATPQFVEVQVAKANRELAPARDTTIEVRLSNGRSLVVAPDFDASHLRALLAVVESKS